MKSAHYFFSNSTDNDRENDRQTNIIDHTNSLAEVISKQSCTKRM